MAKTDKCNVCGYSELEGAPHLQINPGDFGKVRLTQQQDGPLYRCEKCSSVISDTLYEMHLLDEQEVLEDGEVASTVPMWDE